MLTSRHKSSIKAIQLTILIFILILIMEYVQIDPTKPSCAWCYRTCDTLKKCGKCSTRLYCSRECQVQDWKTGKHKQWCGKAGEKGADYQLRKADEKGLGIFLLRGKDI